MPNVCYTRQVVKRQGQLVKRLRRRPLTAETGVRFPYWLLSARQITLFNFILLCYNSYGQLVKRLRRRPLTAETGVRFPYWLLSKKASIFKGLRMLVFVFHTHFHTVSTHFCFYCSKNIYGIFATIYVSMYVPIQGKSLSFFWHS